MRVVTVSRARSVTDAAPRSRPHGGLQGERGDGAVGESEAARIVLDRGVPARQPFEPSPIAELLPFELEVTGRQGGIHTPLGPRPRVA
jgi:hypothetical protein